MAQSCPHSAMNGPVRILHLEDDPDYAKLVQDLLRKDGFEARIVVARNQTEFESALKGDQFDLILADYLLPGYTGLQALEHARRVVPHCSFILLSGTIGENAAIESLRAGATDYVLKQRPERLIPAIRRALQEAHELRLARQTINYTETLFRSVWESSSDALMLCDAGGIIVSVNGALCRLVGVERSELEGKPLTTLYGKEAPADVIRKHQEQFASRRVESLEQTINLANGQMLTVESTANYVEQPGRKPLLLRSLREVKGRGTDDRSLNSQKMEAMRYLAGEVAHDFNNLITVIQGHATLLQTKTELSPSASKSVQQIGEATSRATALTRGLLAFSYRQAVDFKRLDLNELVRGLHKMLTVVLGEKISLKTELQSGAAWLMADAALLEQALTNLAANARDAMPEGGTFQISVLSLNVDREAMAKHAEGREGQFLRLSVKDTGSGIAPENLKRIFEPFFTTKASSKAAGLGLSTVYGIVHQHSGWIEVGSTVGQGTTFDLYLPDANESEGGRIGEKS